MEKQQTHTKKQLKEMQVNDILDIIAEEVPIQSIINTTVDVLKDLAEENKKKSTE